jgi:putative ABC transport system permease protein
MPRIPGLRRVFRLATRRAPVADDVDAEIAFHFEMTMSELTRRGIAPEAAREEARRRFGDVDATRRRLHEIDRSRDRARRLGEWLQGLGQDLRVAARALRRNPGLAAVVVLTLALGVGANSMMFGVVDRLLLRPPAYLRDADRTGRVYFTRTLASGEEFTNGFTGYAPLRDLRERTAGVLDLSGFTIFESVVGEGTAARTAQLGQVSGTFWQLFDARPVLGRLFGPQDDRLPAGNPVVVLGHDYWRRELGGDPAVLGRPLRIGGTVYTVVGVAPKGFSGITQRRVDVWVPLTAGAASEIGPDFATSYNVTWFEIVARRRDGVSPALADARLAQAYRASLLARPDRGRNARPIEQVRPRAALYPVLVDRGPKRGDAARVATWVLGVAAIVLLVACMNVANLLLARALQREREVAVRVALGVGRARLARQLLAEVMLLAALGGAAGLALARTGGVVLTRVLLPDVEWGESLADPRTLLATAAIALAAGLLASLAPAVRALRPDVVTRLRGGARDGGARHRRLRAGLVLAQATLSAVLLVGAGLFVRSLHNVQSVNFGFDPERVAFAAVDLRGEKVDRARRPELYARLAERARALPGVELVGTTFTLPYYMGYTTDEVRVPGRDSATAGQEVHGNMVSGDYFRTMGTRVLRGRVWETASGAPPDGIVLSERLARLLWPGEEGSAVGRCVIVDPSATAPCREVIGVVEDLRRDDPRQPGVAGFYLALRPSSVDNVSGIVVRTRGPARDGLLELQRALQPLVPGAAYVNVRTLESLVSPNLRPWRLGATLFAAFGALGLVVAAVGLYSALAYDVAQRRHDLGVRLALSARGADVVRLVLRRGVAIAVGGVALGLGLALLAGRYVAELLFGVSPRDPLTLGGVAAVLLAAALAASLVPAWRAARVDPARTLRAD